MVSLTHFTHQDQNLYLLVDREIVFQEDDEFATKITEFPFRNLIIAQRSFVTQVHTTSRFEELIMLSDKDTTYEF